MLRAQVRHELRNAHLHVEVGAMNIAVNTALDRRRRDVRRRVVRGYAISQRTGEIGLRMALGVLGSDINLRIRDKTSRNSTPDGQLGLIEPGRDRQPGRRPDKN
jgi:hypothetical protein